MLTTAPVLLVELVDLTGGREASGDLIFYSSSVLMTINCEILLVNDILEPFGSLRLGENWRVGAVHLFYSHIWVSKAV